ncbi:7919_t:CDS:2 [Funneliformis mosseae]|uniref:7919_t:CDS:1 n=1 Tax=Funneliformis mosseae TaxID=27381 RepID=A0A9N9H075_FUNMO|nr:7919_t:CDS:2 [Funneliformis mosseae]
MPFVTIYENQMLYQKNYFSLALNEDQKLEIVLNKKALTKRDSKKKIVNKGNHDLTSAPKTITRDIPALEISVKCKNIIALKAIAKHKQNELTQESVDVDEVDKDVDIQESNQFLAAFRDIRNVHKIC